MGEKDEFRFYRSAKKGQDLVSKVQKEKKGKFTYDDVKKARVYFLERIERIILKEGGEKLFGDINFDMIEGCGTSGPSIDTRLYAFGGNGIVLSEFIDDPTTDVDFIRVYLGRYDDNKKEYEGLVNKLSNIPEFDSKTRIPETKLKE